MPDPFDKLTPAGDDFRVASAVLGPQEEHLPIALAVSLDRLAHGCQGHLFSRETAEQVA